MRLYSKNHLVLIILSLLLYSCSQQDDADTIPIEKQKTTIENSQAGVVLTFDDDYVDEWYNVNSVLKPYDWQATFFVTKFHQLSTDKIQKLKTLKSQGHEIAAHGLNHLNAPNYVVANGMTSYLENEIYPLVNSMKENDLTPTSFAYPYGARDVNTDFNLLKEFKIIRGTTYGQQSPAYHICFYDNNPLVFGLGLDTGYPHFSVPYFISLLEYAKQNNRIVIFYSHKTVPTSTANYETEYQTLIDICKYVKTKQMKFYKISELYQLKNNYIHS